MHPADYCNQSKKTFANYVKDKRLGKISTKIDQTDVFRKLYKLGIFQVKKGQNIF